MEPFCYSLSVLFWPLAHSTFVKDDYSISITNHEWLPRTILPDVLDYGCSGAILRWRTHVVNCQGEIMHYARCMPDTSHSGVAKR